MPFIAFTSKRKTEQVTGRLVVRRIPALDQKAADGEATLFETDRFRAFCITSIQDTVTADKDSHCGQAIIGQGHANLKNSALAHLFSVRSPRTSPCWSWRRSPKTSPAPPRLSPAAP